MVAQPVLILGGFLITDEAYQPMCSWLRQRMHQPVELVPALLILALGIVAAVALIPSLERLERS